MGSGRCPATVDAVTSTVQGLSRSPRGSEASEARLRRILTRDLSARVRVEPSGCCQRAQACTGLAASVRNCAARFAPPRPGSSAGRSEAEVTRWFRVCRHTVAGWLRRFSEEGAAACLLSCGRRCGRRRYRVSADSRNASTRSSTPSKPPYCLSDVASGGVVHSIGGSTRLVCSTPSGRP